MRVRRSTWVILAAAWPAVVLAQQSAEESTPDLDFLEYLGAWVAEDDEWLAIEEWRKDNPEAEQDADEDDTEQSDEDDAAE